VISNFRAVPSTANLGDARQVMAKSMGAKDIFVTNDGQRSGVAVGWLTNSDLARAV